MRDTLTPRSRRKTPARQAGVSISRDREEAQIPPGPAVLRAMAMRRPTSYRKADHASASAGIDERVARRRFSTSGDWQQRSSSRPDKDRIRRKRGHGRRGARIPPHANMGALAFAGVSRARSVSSCGDWQNITAPFGHSMTPRESYFAQLRQCDPFRDPEKGHGNRKPYDERSIASVSPAHSTLRRHQTAIDMIMQSQATRLGIDTLQAARLHLPASDELRVFAAQKTS